jgi:hypothetical protein
MVGDQIMRRAVSVGVGSDASSSAAIIEAIARRRLAIITTAKLLALLRVSDLEQKPGTRAASLAGRGLRSVYLVRRIAEGSVTCGVAALRGEHP